MKIEFRSEESVQALLKEEYEAGARAVTSAMNWAGNTLKKEWRHQIKRAGLGRRLANTIRAEVYPKKAASMNAAAVVLSKAPEVVGAHDRGVMIRSKKGLWLAIPLPAAGKAPGAKRMTPREWQIRNGVELRYVYRPGRSHLLVADVARLTKRGLARRNRRRRRKKDGILTGETTVPIFALVPQVKLPKRLDLFPAADAVARKLPDAIVARWR